MGGRSTNTIHVTHRLVSRWPRQCEPPFIQGKCVHEQLWILDRGGLDLLLLVRLRLVEIGRRAPGKTAQHLTETVSGFWVEVFDDL